MNAIPKSLAEDIMRYVDIIHANARQMGPITFCTKTPEYQRASDRIVAARRALHELLGLSPDR